MGTNLCRELRPAGGRQTTVEPAACARMFAAHLLVGVEENTHPCGGSPNCPGQDLGYLPQGAEESEVLFTLIAERYERRSLGITSNLVFSE